MQKYSSLYVFFAASLWGVDAIILRPALYSLPVPLVVFIESSVVALLLTPILIKNFDSLKQLQLKDWIAFGGVALFGGTIGTMSITKALFYVNFVNLSIVVLIQKLQPIFALILASFILKEKLPRIFFLWALIAIIGAYLLTFGSKLPNLETGDKTIYAALFALLAAFSFGFSTVLSKRALRNVTFTVGATLRFSFSAIIMLFISTITNELSAISDVSTEQVIVFGIIAFTSGGFAIFLYYYGLKRIPASVATIAELAFPFTAILLEYLIRGNIMDSIQWLGAFILIISIIRVTRLNVN
ncbi:MAG: DMT family transporter [Bacteroidetes bacterium]|nr:DMT family transporter [Bacteroidota bacterium]MBU1680727.1 DMT family transporter [Bacteroidota bacterium]MBU2507238.1 DMT family transporter [Bacteroidota bacterium]